MLGGSKPFRQQVLNLIAATPELVPVSKARGGQPEVNLELKPGGAAVKCGSAKAFLPARRQRKLSPRFVRGSRRIWPRAVVVRTQEGERGRSDISAAGP